MNYSCFTVCNIHLKDLSTENILFSFFLFLFFFFLNF